MTSNVSMIGILTTLVAIGSGCGDDGDGGGTEDTGSTGAGSTSTTGMTTSVPADDSTTSDGTTTTTTSSAETTAADTTDAVGTDTGTAGDTGDTGAPQACNRITDQGTCRTTAGCSWIGGQRDVCVDTSDMCAGVMFEMQCNFIAGCVWNEEDMVCMSAA